MNRSEKNGLIEIPEKSTEHNEQIIDFRKNGNVKDELKINGESVAKSKCELSWCKHQQRPSWSENIEQILLLKKAAKNANYRVLTLEEAFKKYYG